MRPAVLVPLVLAGMLCLTAYPRAYNEADGAAYALGAVFGRALLTFGVPALVRLVQLRGSEARRAEPFWTRPFAWAAFAIALVATLAQAAQAA